MLTHCVSSSLVRLRGFASSLFPPEADRRVLRGAFTLSLPNVPIYPELVEEPAAPPLIFARDFSGAFFPPLAKLFLP
ncbi:hypothetical protein COV89_04230 [Candidatus Shapirobacteria bacterium CG11_big_fil_rev_8_21_14_0_20_40_12]|uniref:Uncharacterized protein n=1 Tax=Candidatus Shapirobacteria bacterium CG11_big_fil_rev_8_21_14_0_20_40_12 TaxID=1974889 RepID=A0A2H0KET5_9BACT|nr:MAG: hypothetical protein COV89_04230 [Candidatus Shapirobacteria bacterium CG11_big_fil_rev_8_21_14_0_20_40_12]